MSESETRKINKYKDGFKIEQEDIKDRFFLYNSMYLLKVFMLFSIMLCTRLNTQLRIYLIQQVNPRLITGTGTHPTRL